MGEIAALGIHPKKSLGQNFLVDPAHRAHIVAAAELAAGDAVLEVGPGPGVLTELLAAQADRVVAVELDDRLVSYLRQRFLDQLHVRIVHADILKVDAGALMAATGAPDAAAAPPSVRGPSSLVRYVVVANLPYYITAAAIRHLLESEPPPCRLVLTVQREVAQRMLAQPPDMSLLALGVQFYCTGRIVDRIPAGAFYPVPKVDSAVVRLDRRGAPVAPGVPARVFFRVARAGFSRPRKQLRNALASGLGLAPDEVALRLVASGIAPERRAETLTLDEWAGLAPLMLAGSDSRAS